MISAPCGYSITRSSQFIPAAGGTGGVSVLTQPGCAWTATSQAGFVSITAGNSGNGNGTVNFSVEANGGAPRQGTQTIPGNLYGESVRTGTTTYLCRHGHGFDVGE